MVRTKLWKIKIIDIFVTFCSYRWEKDGEVINNDTDSSGKMILLEDDMVKTLEFDDLNSEEHSGKNFRN